MSASPTSGPTSTAGAGRAVQEWDAVVVGGGIAGLSAAWELARAGMRPRDNSCSS